jgi:chromosome partitioning protein
MAKTTKIWAVSTNKGGVLKTSITTNLAGALSKEGRVLIIDTDNQGNAALTFGRNPDELETTLYDVLVDGADLKKAIINVHKNIDILPANDDMAFFEFDVLSDRNKYSQPFSLLKNALNPIQNEYDYILIDTPPNLGLVCGMVLSVADGVIIPFQPESYSMRSLVKILKAMEDFKTKHNSKLSVLGVVATLVDQRTTLHSHVLQECRKFCQQKGIRMFDTVISRSVRFASSVAYERLPSTLTEENNPVVGNYFDLLEEVKEVG